MFPDTCPVLVTRLWYIPCRLVGLLRDSNSEPLNQEIDTHDKNTILSELPRFLVRSKICIAQGRIQMYQTLYSLGDCRL